MRSPRPGRFAAPLVVTVAAVAGCASGPESGNPPPQNPPSPSTATQPPANPPPVQLPPEPASHPHVNPPPPQLPVASNPANVQKRDDGTCIEFFHVNCPPGVSCNPPPPHPVQCPPGK
jgi:hypothetical protein